MEQRPQFVCEVLYIQPKFEELKRRFPAYVNPDYEAGKRFDPIERCKTVLRESREVVFEYVHMDRDALTDEVLAEMDREGLLPALYEEFLGFAEKYPDEQRKYPIVALGSVCQDDGDLDSPYVFEVDVGRYLNMYWIDNPYPSNRNYRFLAVRK